MLYKHRSIASVSKRFLKHYFNFWVAGISRRYCLLGLACENDKAQVVQKVDNVTHQISLYPVDSVLCSVET